MDDETAADPLVKGIDRETLKKGLERLLTVAGPIARLTPNPYDDLAVAVLRAIVEGRLAVTPTA